MKKKLLWIVGCVALVAVLVGAYFLYNSMQGDYAPGPMIVESSAAVSAPESEASDTETQANPESETGTESPEAGSEPAPEAEASADASEAAEPEPTPVPDFTVLDADGNEVSLSDLKGKPVVLNFWASWCPPCKAEMPDFDAAYKQYGDKLHFMMVNLTDGSRETVDTAKAFLEDEGYSFPVYFDSNVEAAPIYATQGIPSTYFLNADGNLVVYAVGMLSAEGLETGIGMLLE